MGRIQDRLGISSSSAISEELNRRYNFSHTWWPVAPHSGHIITDKLLALWLNSTLGLISVIASRVDTRGAWVDLKKPILEEMLVINPGELSKGMQEKLSYAYDELANMEIKALPQMARDVIRNKIDNALTDALALKANLALLRKLLASEPIISMSLPA